MLSARLNERIDIEIPTPVYGVEGGVDNRWSCFKTYVPAEVTTIRGKEFIAAMQSQFRMDIRVRIRWQPGIDNTQRIVWNGKVYAIVEVMDGGTAKRYIEMVCASGVGGADND